MKTTAAPRSILTAAQETKGFKIESDYLIGLTCLLTSAIILLASSLTTGPDATSIVSLSFVSNYMILLFYGAWLLRKGKVEFFWKSQRKEFQPHRRLLWIIGIVSCFTLNRQIPIFNESAPWLTVTIVLSALASLLVTWEALLPRILVKVLYFLLGTSTILWLYFAIYLIPFYPLSVPGILVFGISIHAFIPAIMTFGLARLLFQKWESYRYPILAGIAFPLLFCLYFTVQWHRTSDKIKSENLNITFKSSDLPSWTVLGQTLDDNWISEKVIKGDLLYQTLNEGFNGFPNGNNLREISRHDPMVVIASLFNSETGLGDRERIKLLEILFDARHDTQERNWSGRSLTTQNVVSHARIYPDYRLAYTEKTLSIRNHATAPLNQQEALYTFYLPEGSVISSLSLWINGKEEKGYLTSQTKADSAYKTIVGIEKRDPSVIHWQEGNRVKVRVFPVTPDENRQFKIGITSPLKVEKGELVYENIYFQGPGTITATETVKLDFPSSTKLISMPFQSETSEPNTMLAKGGYKQFWEARFTTVPLAGAGFTFNGKSYLAEPYQEIMGPAETKTFYLDINQSWSKSEFDELYGLLKNRDLQIYYDSWLKLTADNKDQIFNSLCKKRYTLFPVHKVPDLNTSLLITKGTAASPILSDMKGSAFGNVLKNRHFEGMKLKTFNIGNELSPYFKTLNELRIVNCERRQLTEIKKMISENTFPADPEAETSDNQVIVRIDRAEMLIRETDKPMKQNAPDHLMRLFAYNRIMRQIGEKYLDEGYMKASEINSALIDQASKANIVTPVSSLIVLETQKDYERFDIKKSKNSLDNASIKNSGAVPEPHEWVLILLFGLLVTYYTFRNYVC
jgi:XrtN system VIT domain protein